MSFFRSATLRRIIYAVAIAIALVRFATTRSQSEPLLVHVPVPAAGVEDMLR